MSVDLDGADLIDSFSTGTYQVTRRSAGTFVNGIATPGAESTFSIVAAVVPTPGKELLRLPELRRSIETKTVYTATTLTVGVQGGNDADLILLDGEQWEVQVSGQWPGNSGFSVALVQRPGEV